MTKCAEEFCVKTLGEELCECVKKFDSDKPESYDDIIANLIGRVAVLERMIKELSEVIDIDRRYTDGRIDGVKDDIESWAREHKKTKRELDDKIEMVIDDIVTLDERTQTEQIARELAKHINRRCRA